MGGETILIVDDEEDIRELIAYNLEKEGYRIKGLAAGEEVLPAARDLKPDLIILDLMLPGIDGVEVCRRLRSQENLKAIPIIMLTAKSEDSDIISGLEVGADDYVTKPFSPKVLIARIRTQLRRRQQPPETASAPTTPERISIHGIVIDTARHRVTVDGEPVNLSVTEFDILEFLARNPGWVFSRSQIIGAVKGDDYPVTERSVDVQILGLRKKLGNRSGCLETLRGVGYRIKEEKTRG